LPAARHLAVLHDAHARNRRLLVHGRAASALTKSRRRIAFPNLEARPSSASNSCCQNRKLRPAKWDPKVPCAPRRRGESNKRRLLRRIQSRLAQSGLTETVCPFVRFWSEADKPGCLFANTVSHLATRHSGNAGSNVDRQLS
jgi:hypothetical protein